MRLLKKIIYPAVLGLAALTISCADISFSDPGGYVYSVENGTGGYLKSITVDQWVCADVAPGDSCVAVLYNQPSSATVSYEAEKVFGQGVDDDISDSVVVTMPSGTTETSYTVTLDDDYFSLWISNASSTYAVQRVGYNTDDAGFQSNVNNYDFITNYRTVSSEALERSDLDVTDTLEYGNMSALNIYAAVAEENVFKVDVSDEALVDETVEGVYQLSNVNILKQSVMIYSDGTLVAHDDGEGVLVSDNSGLNDSGTINYETGEVVFSLTAAPVTGVTCDYGYNDTPDGISLAPNVKPGSVVIMAGDTIVGYDKQNSNDPDTGIIEGTGLAMEGTITYSTGEIQFICDTEYMGETLDCRFAYQIGNDNGSGGILGSDIDGTGTIDYITGAVAFTLSSGLPADAAIICDYHRPVANVNSASQWLGFHKRQGGDYIKGIFALVMSSETVVTDYWPIEVNSTTLLQNSYGSYYLEYACTDDEILP